MSKWDWSSYCMCVWLTHMNRTRGSRPSRFRHKGSWWIQAHGSSLLYHPSFRQPQVQVSSLFSRPWTYQVPSSLPFDFAPVILSSFNPLKMSCCLPRALSWTNCSPGSDSISLPLCLRMGVSSATHPTESTHDLFFSCSFSAYLWHYVNLS